MKKHQAPNIVFIMADQLAAQALRLYGNTVCKTPNLDRLAAQGTVFDNAYSNNPLCVPSRASMLTGKLSPKIGVYDSANELPSIYPANFQWIADWSARPAFVPSGTALNGVVEAYRTRVLLAAGHF